MSYRKQAEEHRHLSFDQLGLRQIGERFELWLRLRAEDGQMVLLTHEDSEGATLPSVRDMWAGAAWSEREAAEAFDLSFDWETSPLLLSDNQDRGYLRKERKLLAREQLWPGSFDPAGKTIKPLGAE